MFESSWPQFLKWIKMRVALVANGDIHNLEDCMHILSGCDQVIAVDGGLRYCHQLGVRPEVLIGDWDSVDARLLEQYGEVPKLSFPILKDKTDLEIAVEYALTSATELIVFGALGNRIDHTLYNLILLTRYPGKMIYESEQGRVFAMPHYTTMITYPGQVISFLPMNGPVVGITTQGFRWELKEATFDAHFMSVCNEAVQDKVEITFRQGSLVCFLQK
jgi:thiamine pyrophosphokinase